MKELFIFLKKNLLLFLTLSHQLSVAQEITDLPVSSDTEIIYHNHFILGYSEIHLQSKWVAYLLTKNELNSQFERKNNFRADNLLQSKSITNQDFIHSGYDKGHLMPAEDASFNELAISESFFFTNISPQLPTFNRGQWKALENYVRKAAATYDSIYVFTGPVLNEFSDTIGVEKKIPVAKYFYKILYSFNMSDTNCIGFLMANDKLTDFFQHILPVDSVEKATGINFFPNSVHDKYESYFDINYWAKIKSTQLQNADNKKISKSIQCISITLKGQQCKNKTSDISKKCHIHR